MSLITSSPGDVIIGKVLSLYRDSYYMEVSHIGLKNKVPYNSWETVLIQNKLPKKLSGKKLIGKTIKCTTQYREEYNRLLCTVEECFIKTKTTTTIYTAKKPKEKMDKEESNLEIQGSGLQCDNSACDWADKTISNEVFKDWINRPCPKCGQNLLTEEDFINAESIRLAANLINSLSKEDLSELNATIGNKKLNELKDHPMFKNAKGLDNLTGDGEVTMTVSTHKQIKVDEIKKTKSKL